MNEKIDKIAKNITAFKVETKEEFLEFMLSSIKTIHFIFEDGIITASRKDKEDLDVTFLKLKEKIPQWIQETTHAAPFYPREFVKRILKAGAEFEFISRVDNFNKMKPEDYGIGNSKGMRDFILSRIDKTDENNGLKFKSNSMKLSQDGMPLDVYNAIADNFSLKRKARIYIKFEIDKNFCDAFFRMKFISIHDDEAQQ